MPAKKKGISKSTTKRSGAKKKVAEAAAAPVFELPVIPPDRGQIDHLMAQALANAPKPLNISEIFTSIQGEGRFIGVPSVFVRLNGCNLRCVWCDTPYTSWKPQGEDYMMGGLVAQIRRPWVNHVVITGGEPMLQSGVVLLTQRLREREMHITIETAGTVYQPVVCDLMSISPKLKNSTPHRREGGRWVAGHERLRHQPDVLKRLMADYDYQLKFVIQTPEDVDEVKEMVEQLGAPADRVILMPEGVDATALFDRAYWMIERCINLGYRFSPRYHIDLWSNERGK